MLTGKVMLLGEMGVGKTSIAQQLVFKRFSGNYKMTMGVDILSHDIALDTQDSNTTVRMILWDTDGDFGTRIFDTIYVAGSSGAIIVSDASRPHTVAKMLDLADGFESRFPGRPYQMLINKIDLVEGRTEDLRFSGTNPDSTIFCSAKTGIGIQEAFLTLARDILRRAI